MTSLQAYSLFVTQFNNGDSDAGVSILPSRFVILYNVKSKQWILESVDEKNKNNKIENIQELFILDEELSDPKFENDTIKYALPKLFAKYKGSYSLVDTTCCKNLKIFNYEQKTGNISVKRQDDLSNSFDDYQEAPAFLSENYISISKGEYKVQKTFISYYKFPKDIDIADYEKEDGSPSKNIDPDVSDDNVNQIIQLVIKELKGDVGDQVGYNIASQKVLEQKN